VVAAVGAAVKEPHGLRSVQEPVRVPVAADAEGRPLRISGQDVAEVRDCWVITDEWWRPTPIHRRYWSVLLASGTYVTVFEDLAAGGWYRQRYG